MGEETKHIEVILAGRKYPMRVMERDIQEVKDTVQQLNHDLHNYQIKYGKDIQDCLALVLISKSLDLLSARHSDSLTSDLTDKISLLHDTLDSFM